MNLKKAFVVRSRLTRHYRELENKLESVAIVTEKGKPYKDNPDALFSELMVAGTMLAKVNAAIDKANGNSEARLNLSIQENLRRMLTITSLMTARVEKFEPVKTEYDSNLFDKENQVKGMYVQKEYELHSNKDWSSECESIKRKMRTLEDQLDEINAEVVVDFDQEVLDYICKL